jgi:ribosomal protein L11 methylase PrmA
MVELLLHAPQDSVELASDALIEELGALSVSVEDADAGSEAERALFGEPGMPPPGGWQRSALKALFDDETSARQAAELLLAQDWATGVQMRSITAVEEQDWVRLTQAQFTPVEIAPGFWIVPSWHQPPARATRVMRLDPGLAQGRYPLVLANILASPLKLLAPLLCAHLAPHGDLVLAGILERQADELKAAYAPWLALQVGDSEDGWILMTGHHHS